MKKKILIRLVLAIVLTLIVGFVSDSLMPIFGNDVALDQLEHEDFNFVAMQAWQNLQNWLTIAVAAIWTLTTAFIIKDFYKNKKEKN